MSAESGTKLRRGDFRSGQRSHFKAIFAPRSWIITPKGQVITHIQHPTFYLTVAYPSRCFILHDVATNPGLKGYNVHRYNGDFSEENLVLVAPSPHKPRKQERRGFANGAKQLTWRLSAPQRRRASQVLPQQETAFQVNQDLLHSVFHALFTK